MADSWSQLLKQNNRTRSADEKFSKYKNKRQQNKTVIEYLASHCQNNTRMSVVVNEIPTNFNNIWGW